MSDKPAKISDDVTDYESGDMHVMPTFDDFTHIADKYCDCEPEISFTAPNGNSVWTHKVVQ